MFLQRNIIFLLIFILINDQGGHGYLLVIDFMERKLIWLDYLHYAERHHSRRRAILKLVSMCVRIGFLLSDLLFGFF